MTASEHEVIPVKASRTFSVDRGSDGVDYVTVLKGTPGQIASIIPSGHGGAGSYKGMFFNVVWDQTIHIYGGGPDSYIEHDELMEWVPIKNIACTGRSRRRAFTLVELLVVMFVLAILIALLMPAINGAVRSAKDATVTTEINQLATALADFRSKYNTTPPSRIILQETGIYLTTGTPIGLHAVEWLGADRPAEIAGDLSYQDLSQRSLQSLAKFWPRVQLKREPVTIEERDDLWYDFNGNGVRDLDPIYLEGHECLVFFLGGIPVPESSGAGTSGFAASPTQPFASPAKAPNRVTPFMEFNTGRLVDHDGDGMYGYVDPLGAGSGRRYYAYFSSYGGNGYDPNDVNLPGGAIDASDADEVFARPYRVNFKVGLIASPAPNPYTSSDPATVGPNLSTTFVKPDSFQLISAGRDGLYGFGGRYNQLDDDDRLPGDGDGASKILAGRRAGEGDNLTNFATGPLR